ncbi:FAD-dependent monooxygenase [Streptomyces sp. NPDC091279]|uniref:FAD-dependent monooxygenase n=1 Tax=Streptomyces sp. NPDC091279 TaxID=3365983 RepID=UPI00381FAF8D
MDTGVIVVGAGPTGLMLACELALAGVPTRVVERRIEPQRDSRALSLHPRSVELMDQRGLLDRFLPLGRKVTGWHFGGLPTQLDFAALGARHGYALFLAQARTEAILAERAGELGVEISRGHEVRAVRQDADGVEVEVRGPDDVAQTLRAGYVVGCDGGRSVVRAAAGIGFPGTDETLTGMLGDFAVVDARPGELETARERGVLSVPLEGGSTRFVLLDPELLRVSSREPVTLEEFRAALVRRAGSDCGVGEPRWLSRFGNATRLADRYRAGRVLLAGDAAHIHFPAAGQGLNTGLQDAMNLGWKLAATVNGWAPPGLLDTYEAERRPIGRALIENTEIQTLLFELPLMEQYRRPATALRTLLDELLGMEEVNRRLAGQVSALGTVYPPTTPDADPLVGHRIPDADLPRGRLYPLLKKATFLLLTRPDTPAPPTGLPHLTTLTALHPALPDVTEILIRPDGHTAWATRTTATKKRTEERAGALRGWVGVNV